MARRKDSSEDFFRSEPIKKTHVRRKRPSTPRPHDADSGAGRSKAPMSLRILAWTGVIMLCFVAGFVGTSYALKFFGDRALFKRDDVVQNPKEAKNLLDRDRPVDGETTTTKLDIKQRNLALFYPAEGEILPGNVDVVSRTEEENIREALQKLMILSKMFDTDITVKHVFRNAETVYLNFSDSFIPALSKAGAKNSTLFITGIVRTLNANFPPIDKVRFLVDSKVTSEGAPVDLTATWQLPRQNPQ